MNIKVDVQEDKVVISAPYDKEFTESMHHFNGKWNSAEKTWTVDIDQLDEVREVLLNVYGVNDLTNDLVDVWVTIPEGHYVGGAQAPAKMFGKVIATAWGRDSGAKWGPDIVNKNSKCSSGGSTKNWITDVSSGTFKIKNVSKSRIEQEKDDYLEEGFVFDIIEKGIDKEALREEKERLLLRLAEIDKILKEN